MAETPFYGPGADTADGTVLIAQSNEHPAQHSTLMHYHERAQLLYAACGVMSARTDAGSWVVPPEQAVWIPAGIHHEVECLTTVSMRSLYLRTDRPGRELELLPSTCQVVDVPMLLRELILRACELMERGAQLSPSLESLIIEELSTLKATPLDLPLPADSRLRSITNMLHNNPGDRRSLAQWGDRVGASERTLARLFVAETGLGFSAWRQRLCVQQAIARLDAGESVTAIALDLGYTSASAFVAMFRRVLGVSPARYLRGQNRT